MNERVLHALSHFVSSFQPPANGGISLGAKAAELANAAASPPHTRIPTTSSSSSLAEVNTDALAAAIVAALRHCDLNAPTPYVRILRNPL